MLRLKKGMLRLDPPSRSWVIGCNKFRRGDRVNGRAPVLVVLALLRSVLDRPLGSI